MTSQDYKNLLITIATNKIDLPDSEKNILLSDQMFIDYCSNNYNWDYIEHDGLLRFLDMPKNEESYYLDAFGNRISFNGNRQVKKSMTKLNINPLHESEIFKCSKDFKYFRKYYVKITTKSGIDRPEIRDYQERLETDLTEEDNIITSYPRQSGKCLEFNSSLMIKTNEIEKSTSIGNLFEEIKSCYK
jgi:hypothetical protein